MAEEKIYRLISSIIKHCDIIEETKIAFGDNYKSFEENIIYQNALLTPITQIGELVKRIPEEFRLKYQQIPWKNIAGMRDIIVHGYETIDKVILWDIANNETQKLKSFCVKIKEKL